MGKGGKKRSAIKSAKAKAKVQHATDVATKKIKKPAAPAKQAQPASKRSTREKKPVVKAEEKKPVKPVKEPKPKKERKPVEEQYKFVTATMRQLIKDEAKNLQDKSLPQLKEMLKTNDQTQGGTKDELIQKISEGIVLGRIPRCPKCFGGRPRFDLKKESYSCPGFRDDEKFVNCFRKYNYDELKREPWQN